MIKLQTQILLLKIAAIIHSLLIIGGLFFIITYPFYSNNLFDFCAILIVISFILFKRCLMTDIYELFLNNLNIEYLPLLAKDNLTRHIWKTIIGKKSQDYTKYRLDIINNKIKTTNLDQEQINQHINQKLQYNLINIITTVLILHKYNLTRYIPSIFLFIITNFS